MWQSKNSTFYFLAFAIIGVFFLYFLTYIDNIPRDDEYWLLADFNGFYTKKNIWEQISTLFKVKNSHRFVPVFALYAIILKVLGIINLKLVVFVGFLLLLLFICLLSKPFKGKSPLFIIPILLIFLNPMSYSMTFFAEHVMQYTTLFLSSSVCIYLISYHLHKKFWLLILFAIICSLTFGNGLLIWIIGAILISIKKERRLLTTWGFTGIATYVIFFATFNNTGLEGSPFDFLHYLDKFGVFVISFPGGGMDFFPELIISRLKEYPFVLKLVFFLRLVFIFALPTFCIYLIFKHLAFLRKSLFNSNSANQSFILFTLGLILFVVFSGGLAAIFRSNIGYGEGLAIRYRLFGQLFVFCTYLLYIFTQNFSAPSLKLGLIAGGVYCLASYWVYLPKARNASATFQSSALNIQQSGQSYIYQAYGEGISNEIDKNLLPSILESKTFLFSETDFNYSKTSKSNKGLKVSGMIVENSIILDLPNYSFLQPSLKKFLVIEGEGKLLFLPLSSISYFSKLHNYAGKLKAPLHSSALDKKHKNYYLLEEERGERTLTKLNGLELRK